MAKEQNEAQRQAEIAKNKKAAGDAARKQLGVPARKKSREDVSQAAGRNAKESTKD